jgi:hypothetical protein
MKFETDQSMFQLDEMWNAHRVANFGNEPLKLYGQSSDTQDLIVTVSVNWSAMREKPNANIPENSWAIRIKSTEISPENISSVSFAKIGNSKFEIEKVESPENNYGYWKLRGQIINYE